MPDNLWSWMATIPWFAWVVLAVILGSSLNGLVQQYFRHAERMEMIRQGMNPETIAAEDGESDDE